MALHYDVCDELNRATSPSEPAMPVDASVDPSLDSNVEATSPQSSPPSPPPSSPSQGSHNIKEQYDRDPTYHRTQLESEISMLRAHVEALSNQLFEVRAMCHDLYATRAMPPMIPYCTAPHVFPSTHFVSTVCDSFLRLTSSLTKYPDSLCSMRLADASGACFSRRECALRARARA